jgi:hypothetical protein
MAESIGGNALMTKCAYSLIYVSKTIADEQLATTFEAYSKAETLLKHITAPLKKQIMSSNMKFDKELINYEIEKISKKIVDKLKARTELLRQHTENKHYN